MHYPNNDLWSVRQIEFLQDALEGYEGASAVYYPEKELSLRIPGITTYAYRGILHFPDQDRTIIFEQGEGFGLKKEQILALGFDLAEAKLYTLMLPCPRCADKIAKTKIKYIVAMTHRTKHNGKFDNPLEYTRKVFDKANIKYNIGEPDER